MRLLAIGSLVSAVCLGDLRAGRELEVALADLDHESAYVRERGLRRVEGFGSEAPEVAARVVGMLEDVEFGVRRAAASALVEIAPKAPELRAFADAMLLADEPEYARRVGFDLHCRMGTGIWADLEKLRGHFASGDPRRRRLAANLIDRSNHPNGVVKVYFPEHAEFVDELLVCLEDTEHEDLRLAAVGALDGLRHFSQPVLEGMLEHLGDEPSPAVRLAIVAAVRDIGVPDDFDAVPALVAVLGLGEAQALAGAAAHALALDWPSAKEGAIPALVRVLAAGGKGSGPWYAARSIAAIDPEGGVALPQLLAALEGAAAESVLMAITELGTAAAPAQGRVRELLSHKEPGVRRAAAAALAAVAPDGAETALVTLSESLRDEREVRDDAINDLEDMESKGAAAVLIETFADQMPLAMRHFQRAADSGEPDGDYQLALLYLDRFAPWHDSVAGIRHLTRAAEAGHLEACNKLGLLRLRGEGVVSDPALAESWFRRGMEVLRRDEAARANPGRPWLDDYRLSARFSRQIEAHLAKRAPLGFGVDGAAREEPVFVLSEMGASQRGEADFTMELGAGGQCRSGIVGHRSAGRRVHSLPVSLSAATRASIRELHAELPPSLVTVPIGHAFLYSFRADGGEWETRTYHARALPESLREICRLTGHATLAAGCDPRLIVEAEVESRPKAAFARDGSLTVFTRRGARRWDLAGTEMELPRDIPSGAAAIADGARYILRSSSSMRIDAGDDFRRVSTVEGMLKGAVFSNNARFICGGRGGRALECYSVETGKLVAAFVWPGGIMSWRFALSDEGQTIAALKVEEDRRETLLVFRKGEVEPQSQSLGLASSDSGRESVRELRFLTGDSERLLVRTKRRVFIWHLGEATRSAEFVVPIEASRLRVTGDGKVVAALWGARDRQHVWLWNTATGKRIATLDGIHEPENWDDNLDTIRLSADGSRVAAWGAKGKLYVWDLGRDVKSQ